MGIEQQQQIDIRRVIELAAAELPHGDYGEALRLGAGDALGNRSGHGFIDCVIGKVRQQARHLLKRQFAGEISERNGQRQAVPLPSQADIEGVVRASQCQLRSRICTARQESVSDVFARKQRLPQERGVIAGALDGISSGFRPSLAHPFDFKVARETRTQLPDTLGRFPR